MSIPFLFVCFFVAVFSFFVYHTGKTLFRYRLTCGRAVTLVASLGPLHRTVAACLRTCLWKQALETRSASAAREKVGRWRVGVCESARE